MLKVPVSVILPVKNEAANLPSCLDHLCWADEVFVVDSHSADGTIEIAEKWGAKVVQFEFNGVYPKKKNWAIENLPFKNVWVLIVDADEHIPEALASEIGSAITRPGIDGYFINRQFFFLGRWIKHCGYYPSWLLRLFRRDRGRYERIEAPRADCGDNEVHEHIILDGRSEYLRNDMLHFAYPTIRSWVEKHNRYSEWEAHVAEQLLAGTENEERIGVRPWRKRVLKRLFQRLPFRFIFRFFYAYVLRLGVLDGTPGFIMCGLLSFYDFLSWSKAYELTVTETGHNGSHAM